MSLDDILAAWADTVRLPDDTAAEIGGRIVRTPVHDPSPGLDPAWWRRFTADYATGMVTSTGRCTADLASGVVTSIRPRAA
jgi:hypothetical protein